MFKKCSKCGCQWETRKDYLSDKEIQVIGYQVYFQELTQGMFLFNHSCHTTMALAVDLFLDLYDGPVYTERNNGNRKCPGRCLNKNIESPCSNEYRCTFISKIMEKIKMR